MVRSSSSPAPEPLSERLVGDLLLDAADQLREVFTRACATEHLSMAEGRTLRFLCRGARQADLADLLSCGPSRVTGLLQELENRDFIRRSRSRGDRRQHDIVVTQDGLDALIRIHEVLDATSPFALHIEAEERAQLAAILLRLLGSPVAASAPVEVAS